eukprot:3177390-Pyramimonas_sp.AAC.1
MASSGAASTSEGVACVGECSQARWPLLRPRARRLGLRSGCTVRGGARQRASVAMGAQFFD